MKKLLLVIPFVIALGCATTARTVTFKTIEAQYVAVKTAMDAYNLWAARQEVAHPEKSADLLRLDGRVKNSVDAYKAGAKAALLVLKTNDVPTLELNQLAAAVFATVGATNGF